MAVTLYYFALKGLGESIRLLLSYGNQKFEDHRVLSSDWPKFKSTTPNGTMPVLEINGKKYGESVAISRYLGRQYGIAGDTNEESLKIDEIVDLLTDFRNSLVSFHYEDDETIKAKKREEVMTTVVPQFLEKLDETIKKNDGHLALGKLTWADFLFAGIYDYIKHMLDMPDLEKKYPNFKDVVDAVYTIPQVKKFSESVTIKEYDY